MVLFGHCLSGSCRGGNLLYLIEGSLSLAVLHQQLSSSKRKKEAFLTWAWWNDGGVTKLYARASELIYRTPDTCKSCCKYFMIRLRVSRKRILRRTATVVRNQAAVGCSKFDSFESPEKLPRGVSQRGAIASPCISSATQRGHHNPYCNRRHQHRLRD